MTDLPAIRDAADFWIAGTTGRERELAIFFRAHVDRVIHCHRCGGTGTVHEAPAKRAPKANLPCPRCEKRRAEVLETYERIKRCSYD